MHVSPAKHSYESVTDGRTDRRRKKWSLCVAMLRRRHKNTNLVEDLEILLPVKFLPIRFRGEVKNVSANQRPGRPSWFSDRPEKHKLGEYIEILLPVKFRRIPLSGFREEVKSVSANRARGGHLVFPIGPKNTSLVEDIEILLSVKFSWILFSGFRGEVKNVKVNDGRTTYDHNSALEPSAQVH